MAIKQPRDKVVVINYKEQLLEIINPSSIKTVSLQLPSLTENKKSYWENRLAAEKNACGCSEGTAFLLVVMAIEGVLIFTGSSLFPQNIAMKTLLCIVLALISIAIGKAIGRYRATRRFMRSIQELYTVLSAQPETAECK